MWPRSLEFNTSLLKDKEYLSLVKTWINDEKLKYAIPIYNFENTHTIPDESLCLNIDFDLFFGNVIVQNTWRNNLNIRAIRKDKRNKLKKT